MQSLTSCKGFALFIQKFLQFYSDKETDLSLIFAKCVSDLREGRELDMNYFYEELCCLFTNSYNQEDSHELLIFLLDNVTEY